MLPKSKGGRKSLVKALLIKAPSAVGYNAPFICGRDNAATLWRRGGGEKAKEEREGFL